MGTCPGCHARVSSLLRYNMSLGARMPETLPAHWPESWVEDERMNSIKYLCPYCGQAIGTDVDLCMNMLRRR
jgi:hypothetical protein